MYRLSIKITGRQREALYEQVRNHLAALGDVFVAMETDKDFATAERLAIEFSEDFRLLEDLGWGEDDNPAGTELTMAPEDLTELMRRLLSEAKSGLADARSELQATTSGEEIARRYQAAAGVCEKVLATLIGGGGGNGRRA
jgi:hypothetical protein